MTRNPRRTTPSPGPTLLTLPYDLRHQIYTHLFPPTSQIYVQAQPKGLRSLLAEHSTLPLNLLCTSRLLHAEAAAFLYNNYLFNVVGTKRDCLAHYAALVTTVRRHAHEPAEVRVDAFSNGLHSSTMCVSVQAGRGKVRMLEARGRGVRCEIGELWREVQREEKGGAGAKGWWTAYAVGWFAAVLTVVVAWLVLARGWA